jgi:hypothetical protein
MQALGPNAKCLDTPDPTPPAMAWRSNDGQLWYARNHSQHGKEGSSSNGVDRGGSKIAPRSSGGTTRPTIDHDCNIICLGTLALLLLIPFARTNVSDHSLWTQGERLEFWRDLVPSCPTKWSTTWAHDGECDPDRDRDSDSIMFHRCPEDDNLPLNMRTFYII